MGPFAFMIADDGQAPKGRESFERSFAVQYFGNTAAFENEECFAKKKNHYMLADMYAMALSDLHMGMVISSCDDITVIWRRARGRQRGTSYPTECYNGYYDSKPAA